MQQQYSYLFGALAHIVDQYQHEVKMCEQTIAMYDSLIQECEIEKKVEKHKKEAVKKAAAPTKAPVQTAIDVPTETDSQMKFILPIPTNKFWISSYFGPRKKPDGSWGFHHGIDMASIKGTKVKVAADGTVLEARIAPGYGKTILVKHSDSIQTRYAHLDKMLVVKGQCIKQSEIIGLVGETGLIRKTSEDGSHLHFEVYEQGHKVNPLAFLPHKKHA